jgi:hypothetical protein
MSFYCTRTLGGNVFTESLPSNGYTGQNIFPDQTPDVDDSRRFTG